jgi:hypothetical protein
MDVYPASIPFEDIDDFFDEEKEQDSGKRAQQLYDFMASKRLRLSEPKLPVG